MNILGIHDGHNASAALLVGRKLVRVVQEERFSGLKNHGGFPTRAVEWILRDTGLRPQDLDAVVLGQWSKSTGYTREEILASYHRTATEPPPVVRDWFRQTRVQVLRQAGVYEQFKARFDTARFTAARGALPTVDADRITAVDHHTAHAAGAYYGAHFTGEPALVLTLDGQGDGLCATVNVADAGGVRRIASTPAGHSIGDIYARVTHLMGMVPLEHEYKLMGLAPYVEDEKAEKVSRIFEQYVEVDGLAFRRRTPEATPYIGARLKRDLEYVRFDAIAAGLQRFTEKRMVEWARNALRHTGLRKLALGGGTFMNVKANGLIARLDEVDDIFICPSCGDESLSLGAAWQYHADRTGGRELPEPLDTLYLGPDIDPAEAVAVAAATPGAEVVADRDLPHRVAELLADGEIVARCAGRTEFGARALGNRSLFADPARPLATRTLNQAIKMRDFWMPFAPIMLSDRQGAYLLNPKGIRSPHMMFAYDTYPERFADMASALQPADRTARAQLVLRGQNPEVEAMLEAFEARTGRAVVLNTSYNIHGEAMVSTPAQGLDVLRRSGLKWLWLGPVLIRKA
jgi:carbamoyltransferase